jgi:hypothetical protein
LHGYEQHKNILLDVIDYLYPEVNQLIQTNAHERIEVILQDFIRNIPENINRTESEGMILHLVNLTGFSGNTYFEPLPVYDIKFSIKPDFKPTKIFGLVDTDPIDFTWQDGRVNFSLNRIGPFESIVLAK